METIKFDASQSFAESLKRALEAEVRVTLHLRGGHQLTGRIQKVDDHSVVVAGLTQRELFDAQVSLGSIDAIEAQARTP
jgi:ribosome maturation factor RimP